MENEPAAPLADALVAAIPGLRAFAVSLCGNRSLADDLVQETLVKAWSKQDSFTPGTNLKAWLFTILRNTYFSQWRKRRHEADYANGVPAEALDTRPEQPGHMELQDFRVALQKLPEERREALILVGAVGLSYQEAARICGCEPGTIKSRVSRARSELACIMSRWDDEVEEEREDEPSVDDGAKAHQPCKKGRRSSRRP